MSKDHNSSAGVESPKDSYMSTKPLDLNELEMVFGTPSSPKSNMQPDVHLINNERTHTEDTHHKNHPNNTHDGDSTHPSQPLLEPNNEHQKPPLAGPEIDDLDDGHTDTTPFPGIDNGLLEPGDVKPELPDGDEHTNEGGSPKSTQGDGVGTDDGKWQWPSTDVADSPYDGLNGIESRFGVDDRPGSPFPPGTVIPDLNTYQQKKNLAQGMMDLALLSANANQLRYVLESSTNHPYFYPSIVFISVSIILQIAVGIGLIMNSRYNVTDDKEACKADRINNFTVLGIFLVTIVNVFITSFSVATPTTVSTVPMSAVIQQAG